MKNIPIFFIWIYKKIISPLFPPRCKYYPSCSEYSMQAFKKHGFFKGAILSVWRLLRCNPFSKGGVDHVPESFEIIKRRK